MTLKKRLREFVTRYELGWHAVTVALFGLALVVLVVAFPDVSNTWVSVFVLVGSFTTSVTAMIGALKTKSPEEKQ